MVINPKEATAKKLKAGPATGAPVNIEDLRKQFAKHDATHSAAVNLPAPQPDKLEP